MQLSDIVKKRIAEWTEKPYGDECIEEIRGLLQSGNENELNERFAVELEFGTGDVNFVKTFETLKKAEFKGPFLVEMWNESSETPLEDIKKVRDWMISRMKEGGFI